MGIGLLFLICLVVSIVVLLLLARAYPGTGADLVDWDPEGREAARAEAEREDLEQLHALRARRDDAEPPPPG